MEKIYGKQNNKPKIVANTNKLSYIMKSDI